MADRTSCGADDAADRANARRPRCAERFATPDGIAPAPLPPFDYEPESREGVRETPLAAEHERLGARMIDFAGWRLPVWYSGVGEEHAAVREAAGLFDIGHMGLIEIAGPGAAELLDVVATGRARDCAVGGCRYTFLLDPDGLPLDDIIICRRDGDDFLAVVNAANAERVWAWLQAVVAGECLVDARFPHHRVEAEVTLRDLRAESAGDDRLVGMALQGPASAEVLQRVRGGARATAPFRALGRFEFAEDRFADIPALISRTGYTGEAVGYELFVHPDAAAELWRALLVAGEEPGVLPAGLGARDSTRIEAGLPLFGHELAGPHEITPGGAGYGRFVRLDKAFFVGRQALIERERARTSRIARFRLDGDRARAIRAGDPVGSRRGELVGWVTSCAPAGDRQVGLAWLDERAATVGAGLLVFPARQAERSVAMSALDELSVGDRVPLHESATVIPRFLR